MRDLLREYLRLTLEAGTLQSPHRGMGDDDVRSHLGVKNRALKMRAGNPKADAIEPEIFDMISKAYDPIGGHAKLSSRADVSDEYPEWMVADIDDDPETDVALVGQHSAAGGTKVGASGTDGSMKAKLFMSNMKSKLMKPGGGWWGEVSGAPAHIALTKLGLKAITDRATAERLLGKKVNWIGPHPEGRYKGIDGWYSRDLGNGHEAVKIIVGDIR